MTIKILDNFKIFSSSKLYIKLILSKYPMFNKGKMDYRKFGNSGLEVSVISFGNWMKESCDF